MKLVGMFKLTACSKLLLNMEHHRYDF